MAPFNGNGKGDPATWVALLYRLAMIGAVTYLAMQHRHIGQEVEATHATVSEVAGARSP